jgi:hypothetical protein
MRCTFPLRMITTKRARPSFESGPCRLTIECHCHAALSKQWRCLRNSIGLMNEGIEYDIEISNGTRRDER